MTETLESQLRGILTNLPEEDVHAVAAFAEFLFQQRQKGATDNERRISDDGHSSLVAALDNVAVLSMETGPPASNRDHDQHLYGGQ